MRTIFRCFSLIGLCLVAAGSTAALSRPRTVDITINDVAKRVKSENFTVYGNALKVYQAKQRIHAARMSLLPRLNLWRLSGVAVDAAMGNYISAIGVVTDIAPFLVPANWFAIKSAKILYEAEKEGYRALWANELATAKGLYYHLLLDEALLKHVAQSQRELKDILLIVISREVLGGVPQGTSLEIEGRMLSLQEDARQLESLIEQERAQLAFILGYSAPTLVRAKSIDVPDIGSLKPLKYAHYADDAVSLSPEVRQFGHFIAASAYIKKEIQFSFLGGSTLSRGVAGGVFDSVPTPDGLGFDLGANLRISKAHKEMLGAQQLGAMETVKRHLQLLVNNYNLDLANYASLKRRTDLTQEMLVQLNERLFLGQDVDALSLIEASRNHIQADTAFFAVQYRFLSNRDRLARLTFQGHYADAPPIPLKPNL